jgi:hypothetical protein
MGFILFEILSLALLVALFSATGRLVEWAVSRGHSAFQPAFVTRQALGMAVWVAAAFCLAASGLLARWLVFVLAGVMVLAYLVAAVRGRAALEMPSRRDVGLEGLGTAIAASSMGLLLWALFLQTIWPAVGWDANVYHLTVPRLWAEAGGFRPIAFNVYSNWPLNTELLFLVASLLRDYVLAKLIHYWLGVLTLIAVFWIVRRSAGALYGWFAAALVLCNQIVLAEFRVAYVDLAFAFFFFLAFLHLQAGLERERPGPRDLIVVGLLAGVVAGIKLTGIFAVLCLAILLVLEWPRGRRGEGVLVRALAVLLLPSGVVLLAWFVKSWIFTGNPVYPFLYGVFGGPDWSPELGERLHDWQQGIGMGRGLVDYLLLPVRVVLMGDRGYGRFDGQIHSLWLVWIPLSVWMARGSVLVRRCLWVAGLYFVSWSLTSQQMRFLIPILPFLATAASCSLAELLQRIETRFGRPLSKYLLPIAIVLIVVLSGGRYLLGGWRLTGVYLEEGGSVRETVMHPIYRFINETLPDDSRLLMLNTNHGFFCHREYLADSFFEASQTRELVKDCETKLDVAETLRSMGLTHILIENRDLGIPYPRVFREFLSSSEGLAEPIFSSEDGRFVVLELR